MRILVISDSHGDLATVMRAVDAQPSAEVIVFCGDGEEQYMFLKDNYKDKMVVGVRGNCDWSSTLPAVEYINVCGKKIMITHDHLYDAKSGCYRIMSAAREQGADILFFGHTHCAATLYEDGLYVLNPGSCHGYLASYGYADITERGDVVLNTVKIK